MRFRFPGATRFPKPSTTLRTLTSSRKTRTRSDAERALSSNDQQASVRIQRDVSICRSEMRSEGKKSSGLIDKVFGNIEAAPILIIGSGRPINPLTGFDANRSGAFPLSSRPLGFWP